MKAIITLLLVAVAVAGIAFYLLFSVPAQEVQTEEEVLRANETTVAEDESGNFSGVGTLTALQARGKNLECSVSYTPNDYEGEVSGTYFISDGKVRGDFIVPAPDLGGTIVSSMITNPEMMYFWSEIDGQLFGVKVPIVSEEQEGEFGTISANEPVPNDVDVRYDCKVWQNVDNSIFEPPSGVLFQDTSDISDTGMEYGTIYEEGELSY